MRHLGRFTPEGLFLFARCNGRGQRSEDLNEGIDCESQFQPALEPVTVWFMSMSCISVFRAVRIDSASAFVLTVHSLWLRRKVTAGIWWSVLDVRKRYIILYLLTQRILYRTKDRIHWVMEPLQRFSPRAKKTTVSALVYWHSGV